MKVVSGFLTDVNAEVLSQAASGVGKHALHSLKHLHGAKPHRRIQRTGGGKDHDRRGKQWQHVKQRTGSQNIQRIQQGLPWGSSS